MFWSESNHFTDFEIEIKPRIVCINESSILILIVDENQLRTCTHNLDLIVVAPEIQLSDLLSRKQIKGKLIEAYNN